MEEYDFEQVAQEFMRELRAHRSQVQWSRWLGYKSNVAYPWESGRRYPSAAETLRAIHRSKRDLKGGIKSFYGHVPCVWLNAVNPSSPEGVSMFMQDLRGGAPLGEVAQATGVSRFSISRWLSGKTQPRLPDFFRYIHATSVRLPDFLAAFVDPAKLPSIAPIWKRIEARRQGAAAHPWTQAILRTLELPEYLALEKHTPGWIANRLNLPLQTELDCMEFLELVEQVKFTGTHYHSETHTVDTRSRPEVSLQLKRHWSQVAAERIDQGAPGQYSYNVFSVSRADFEKIRSLHLDYFNNVRSIVAESQPDECVAVINVQLFALEDHPEP